MKTQSYRQWLIHSLARARRDEKAAYRNDRNIRKIQACADDETIYLTYITSERVSCYEAALRAHRALTKGVKK